MKNLLLVCVLLVGCNDDSFRSVFPLEASGGAMTLDESDASPIATGGAPGTSLGTGGDATASGGAVTASGGAAPAATGGCPSVTHDTGVGQIWSDCTSSGAHDETQAKKACLAWCAAVDCANTCFSTTVCGINMEVGQIGSSGHDVTMTGWAWGDPSGGNVFDIDPVTQVNCKTIGSWN